MEFISEDESAPLKSLLKKVRGKHSIRHRRVTFDDLVTYYTDDEVHVLSLRTPELNDVFCMFEPPPEYQDCLPFEPPEQYKDQDGEIGSSGDDETDSGDERSDTVVRSPPTWEEERTSFVEDDCGGKEETGGADASESEDVANYDLELGLLKQLELDDICLDGEEIFSFNVETVPKNVTEKSKLCGESKGNNSADCEINDDDVIAIEKDAADSEQDDDDDVDDDVESAKGVVRSNSQIRRIIEKNAITCTLLKGIEAKKRQTKRPKSPLLSTQSLVEQLKWLTSVDDDQEKPHGCESTTKDAKVQRTVKLTTVVPTTVQDLKRIQPLRKRNAFRAHFEQSLKHHATYSSMYETNQSIRVIPGGNDTEQRIEIKLRQIKTRSQSPRCASDELERFVQQDLERIERIRKRYSVAEEDDDPSFGFARRPSVRGIRPRFGSTTEILKQIQTQLQSPPLPHNRPSDRHMIWTYANRKELHHLSIPANQIVSSGRDKKTSKDKRYYSHVDNIPTSMWFDKERKMSLTANIPLYLQAQPNQTMCQDERGTPEGASSSPKVSFDSLYPVEGAEKPSKDGVIYYSLNV